MLPDGTYEAMVIDADEGPAPATVVLNLTVLTGPHKGDLVPVTVSGLDRDPLDLFAVPALLVVADGLPTVTLEA